MLLALAVLLVLIVGAGAIFVWWDELAPRAGLGPPIQGSRSHMIGQRVPGFTLPGVVGRGIEARDLLTGKKVIVVKFWGSWSPACIQEYPQLMELQAAKVEMWAIAFRDTRTNALDYLERNGNPYARVALDIGGRVASDWGVASAPSTFIVDGEGIIRYHRAGPLTSLIVTRELWPMLDRLTL